MPKSFSLVPCPETMNTFLVESNTERFTRHFNLEQEKNGTHGFTSFCSLTAKPKPKASGKAFLPQRNLLHAEKADSGGRVQLGWLMIFVSWDGCVVGVASAFPVAAEVRVVGNVYLGYPFDPFVSVLALSY